jgi:hypothetical protein
LAERCDRYTHEWALNMFFAYWYAKGKVDLDVTIYADRATGSILEISMVFKIDANSRQDLKMFNLGQGF